jgi:hypothetical protein
MVVAAAPAAAALTFAVHCGHEQSRCDPLRRPGPTPALPSDVATGRAVEQSGFHYQTCPGRPRYRLVRPGTRALTSDEIREVGRNLLPTTPATALRGEGFGRATLVAVTGYGRADDVQRSRACGFDRHLVKPVDVAGLRRITAAAMA